MALRAVRYLDFVVLALALPIFVAAGLPLLGWAGATAAWLLQRGAQSALARRAAASRNPHTAAGVLSASLLGRLWFLVLAVLGVGLIDREAGLAAAVLTAIVFQAWFTAFMLGRGTEGGPRRIEGRPGRVEGPRRVEGDRRAVERQPQP
jgi:hypothetical protein